jgi:hypothetical protein
MPLPRAATPRGLAEVSGSREVSGSGIAQDLTLGSVRQGPRTEFFYRLVSRLGVGRG